MKHFLFGAALATLVGSTLAADVGVSVSVGQPGFYGRIDIGNVLQPQLVYPSPVIIQQVPIVVPVMFITPLFTTARLVFILVPVLLDKINRLTASVVTPAMFCPVIGVPWWHA